jgi:peptidoglycan LD-endopeptidase CwlK
MSTYIFGTASIQRLSTCHPDLQKILNTALKVSDVDFGVAEGYRSVEDQQRYFKEGKSKIDGVTTLGKHNEKPSMAADIYPFIGGKANYDLETLSYLAGIFHAVSEMLYNQREITHHLRWGGNWDMDGEVLIDQSFDDRPHIELVK